MRATPAAAAVGLALMVAACGSSSSSSSSSAASSGSASSGAASGSSGSTGSGSTGSGSTKATGSPVTLGGILTLSGPFAQVGDSDKDGAMLAAQQINAAGGADGHPIKLDIKDEQASATTTVADVRSLLGSNVKLMFGGTDDSDCLAAAPQINGAGGDFVGLACQTNLLETSKFVPGFFSIAPSNYMLGKATALFAKQKFGSVKTWNNVGPDYQFGHETWSFFQSQLKALEPSVGFGKSVFIPLTATQYGPYVNSMLSGTTSTSASDTGLLMSTFSATTIGLAQAGQSFNLFKKYKAVLNIGGSTPTAQALKANTPPLYFIYDYYNGDYHNAANTKFVAAYKKAYGQVPNAWAYEGYTGVMAYAAGIAKAKSTDPTTLRTAMAGMSFSTPKGMLTFRQQDHQLESPVSVWGVDGDKSAPGGFKFTYHEAVPAAKVLPAPNPA